MALVRVQRNEEPGTLEVESVVLEFRPLRIILMVMEYRPHVQGLKLRSWLRVIVDRMTVPSCALQTMKATPACHCLSDLRESESIQR